MKISVIIPVCNREAMLRECLAAICANDYPDREIIVVDDASTDRTADTAREFPCEIIALETNGGAAAARNRGAQAATGDILAFIDADIIVEKDSLAGIAAAFEDPGVGAVVGLYTARHRNRNVCSQYKNLWIRYTYLKSPKYISWIFTSITGIRKTAFDNTGGFNPNLRSETGIDDLECGMRLSEAGHRILLDHGLEVEHLKVFTMPSFLRNQYIRSRSFAEVALRTHRLGRAVSQGRFANVTADFTSCVLLAHAIPPGIICSVFAHRCVYGLLGLILLYVLLNIGFLAFVKKAGQKLPVIHALAMLYIDHWVCGIGVLRAIAGRILSV